MSDFFKDLMSRPSGPMTMPTFRKLDPGVKVEGDPPVFKPTYGYDLSDIMTADIHQLESAAERTRKALMAQLLPGVEYRFDYDHRAQSTFLTATPVGVKPEWQAGVLTAANLLKVLCP